MAEIDQLQNMELAETADSLPIQKEGETRSLTADDGCKKTILVEGEGSDTPEKGDEVFVHYVGTLLDGSKFDSSRDREGCFEFKLGLGQVIKGWDTGVATMRKGEKCNLVCAPDYAYGANGSPPTIPPNSTLNFEVELLRWKSANDINGDGGCVKKIETQGKGYRMPKPDDEVTVAYTAKLEDGTVVGETGEAGVSFTVQDGHLCDGIKTLVTNMKPQEKANCTLKDTYVKGCAAVPEGQKLFVTLSLLKVYEVLKVEQGILKKTVQEGEGYTTAKEGAKVGAKFVGKLADGTIFEQSEGDDLFCWTVEEEEMPLGLDKAVQKMKKGEKAIITLDPEHAFGAEAVTKPLATVPADSTVVYELELVELENPKDSYMMSTEEKFACCDAEKGSGNTLFKAGKYERALKKYARALTAVEADSSFSDEEKEKAKGLKLPLHLNKAAVQLKLKAYADVKASCSKALDMEAQNVKALFRRSQAHFQSGDADLANKDLKAILEVDPNNRDARNELKKVKDAMKAQYRKDAKQFGNMFSKGDLYNEPKPEVQDDAQPDVPMTDLNVEEITGDAGEQPPVNTDDEAAVPEEDKYL